MKFDGDANTRKARHFLEIIVFQILNLHYSEIYYDLYFFDWKKMTEFFKKIE